jgi:FMN phosphatase YigB (HAD superfamily)/lambda repressor-like predicted transcriptional regulator
VRKDGVTQMEIGGVLTEEKQLGRVVQVARKEAGLTQQALCQKSGLSYSTLAKIERGAIKAPSVFTIQHIARTLGISLDQLLAEVPGKRLPVAVPAGNDAGVSTTKKVSRNGVKFVYFDMNGCLVRGFEQAFTALAEDAGVTPDVVESIFWQYNDQVNRGDMSIDDLNTILAERLNIMVDWYRYYLNAVEATPGMDELAQWVTENYHAGILTNTMPGLVESMQRSTTLPAVFFDVIIDSSQVHALKPEAQMYAIAAEQAGVEPHEILLIDDDVPNLAAAGRAGWQTISFDPYTPEESIVHVSTALQPADE